MTSGPCARPGEATQRRCPACWHERPPRTPCTRHACVFPSVAMADARRASHATAHDAPHDRRWMQPRHVRVLPECSLVSTQACAPSEQKVAPSRSSFFACAFPGFSASGEHSAGCSRVVEKIAQKQVTKRDGPAWALWKSLRGVPTEIFLRGFAPQPFSFNVSDHPRLLEVGWKDCNCKIRCKKKSRVSPARTTGTTPLKKSGCVSASRPPCL